MEGQIPTKLVPLKWVVKVEPPQIGLVYKLNEKDKKKRIYIIELNDLVMVPDAMKVAARLFMEHPLYLNRSVVKPEQVARLVQRIQEHYNIGREEDEYLQDENMQSNLQSDFKNQFEIDEYSENGFE